MSHVRGSNGVVYGIINTGGRVWQEQRRFALQKLKDFGFGRRGLDRVIQEEAKEAVEYLLSDDLNCVKEYKEEEGGGRTLLVDSAFNIFVINVLWQIVASKRFDPASEASRKMMQALNDKFRKGAEMRPFPELNPYLPLTRQDLHMLGMKRMMREHIEEHLQDYSQDSEPRDFVDVYIREIKSSGNPNFNIEQLESICVDFFQAGSGEDKAEMVQCVSDNNACFDTLRYIVKFPISSALKLIN